MVVTLVLVILCGFMCESITGQYVSPTFWIKHWSSGKFVHPKTLHSWYTCPIDWDRICIHRDQHTNGRITWRFRQVEGHWGYIEHNCGKVVQPWDARFSTWDNINLDICPYKHGAALFYYDIGKKQIVHKSGRKWVPYGGWAVPGDNTDIVLHSSPGDSSRFEFVTSSMQPVAIYPEPNLYGKWQRIFAVANPATTYQHQLSVKVGKSVTKSATENFSWEVSAQVAVKWFTASTTVGGYVEKTETTTWDTEVSRTTTISVSPGATIAVWQYMFEAEQFGDKLTFQSTILANTNDVNTVPNIIVS